MRTYRLAGLLAALIFAASAAVAGDAFAAPTTTFNYTGAPQTYVVPAGTSYIIATAIGARGGDNTYSPIAAGAQVSAQLPVTPGEVLYVYAGGHGVGANNGQSGGWNGGGNGSGYGYGGTGGGASDIRTALGDLSSRILIAGGGGGPGNNLSPAPGGNGGGSNGTSGQFGTMGTGGGEFFGGIGGLSNDGGPAGTDGSLGQGGTAGSDPSAPPMLAGEAGAAGGGGGGGWYGGGGGGASSGGGGGSNYFAPDATHTTASVGPIQDGQVTITAVDDSFTVTPNPYSFGNVAVDSQAEHTFTVTNTGNIAETPMFAGGGGGPYGYSTNAPDSCTGQTLNPGESCTYDFAFQPPAGYYGPVSSYMDIALTETSRKVRVNLTGTAVPATPRGADSVYNGQYNQPMPAIGIKDADAGATVDLYVDGQHSGTATAGVDGTATITPQNPIADGQHTLTFRQTSGSYDSPIGNDANVTVKTAPPTITWPTAGMVDSYPRPGVGVSGALANLPVNYYIDGQLVASENAGYDGEGGLDSASMPNDLTDGIHTTYVTTTDTNGHEAARSQTVTFTIDTTAPDAPTVTDPADGSVTTHTTPDIHVSAEPGSRVHLLVDSNNDEGYQTADADGHVTFPLNAPLSDGQHQLVVFARDSANNDSAQRWSTFTVDTAAPAGPAVTGGPQGTTTDRNPSFEFSGEAGASFECSLDGAAFTPCTSPQSYSNLADGEHTFQVRQTDSAGHTSEASTQTFTIKSSDSNPNPTPAKDASKLTLVVAKTGTISHGRVPVGCRIDAGELASCAVKAYAGGEPVGIGSTVFRGGGRLGGVQVKLTARGKRLVHRVGGVKLRYRGRATTSKDKTLHATSASGVLPLTVAAIPSDGLFALSSAHLNRYGQRFVRSLAAELDGAKRVRCIGYTDSVGAAAYNKRLGRARAKAFCAQLRHNGIKARRTVRSFGERHPRATNRTAAGRALNRRVELLVHYR